MSTDTEILEVQVRELYPDVVASIERKARLSPDPYVEVIQDANGDEMERGEPDPVSEPVDGLHPLFLRDDVSEQWREVFDAIEVRAALAADTGWCADGLHGKVDVTEHTDCEPDVCGIAWLIASRTALAADLRAALAATPAEDRGGVDKNLEGYWERAYWEIVPKLQAALAAALLDQPVVPKP